MENQHKPSTGIKRRPRWGRILLWILTPTLIVITAVYITVSILSARAWVIEKNQNYTATLTNKALASDSAFLALQRELAWVRAKLELSRNDSIALILDLEEKQAFLKIRGVTVHQTPISNIKIDRGLQALEPGALNDLLSSPLRIKTCFATFEKEPIVTVQAPKDTLASPIPQLVMDTAIHAPFIFYLELDHNIRLVVLQQEDESRTNGTQKAQFLKRIARNDTWNNILRVATFQLPRYTPQITLQIPKSDVRIMYRAVPVNGRIAITL